jgi:hypothetical protein
MALNSILARAAHAHQKLPAPARAPWIVAQASGAWKRSVKTLLILVWMRTKHTSSPMAAITIMMGTFMQDYEFVAGFGDLDECNGRFGVTPEFPKGVYHYYVTETYPYIQRCVKGTPSPETDRPPSTPRMDLLIPTRGSLKLRTIEVPVV